MLKEKILSLVDIQKRLATDAGFSNSRKLPEQCYLIDDGAVLCYPRGTGNSRYPYSRDGFTLWAYSSGDVSLNESTFYCILPSDEGKQPYAAFFGGQKTADGYVPVSITGTARQAREDVLRYTIFTPEAVFYITETKDAIYFLRAFVAANKEAVFTVGAINTSGKRLNTYLSSYFNLLCMHAAGESVETKWFKQSSLTNSGYLFESVENVTRTKKLFDYCAINRAVTAKVKYDEHTCSRSDYTGGTCNAITCADPLFTGHFSGKKDICKFGDTAIAGDIYNVDIAPGDIATIDYVLTVSFDKARALKGVRQPDSDYADSLYRELKNEQAARAASKTALKAEFGEFISGPLSGKTFTGFIDNVIRQVEFGALAKNSGVSLLGVRDVVQQIEAALIWTPEKCRAKLIEVLGFIDPCGRPPRQYSLPAEGALPAMDTRAFIDQGVWIISAMYSYLAYTGDSSILDEQCGYYKIVGDNRVEAVDERNSVFEHIVRIADYLINNTDEKTGCLHALYGDWNDALDGLGVSRDPTKKYGTGVSVMASLQLYQNLNELLQIFDKYGDPYKMKQRCIACREKLIDGLKKYAIDHKEGKRKIIHGWGDGLSYKVGSYNDCDGLSRDGLTAGAFWIISGAYLWDKSIKTDILESFSRLDSKYGLKTFEPYFAPDVQGVGRIVDLPKGTAENGAVYVHAAIFGIWSLFMMGESKAAWEQLYKILPLTHSLITTTPFIMSNSYSYNEELGLDGESMSDWFTGSANTLIKAVVRYIFGVVPDLNGVAISPAGYLPLSSAALSLSVCGKRIRIEYENIGRGKREFALNGKNVETSPNASSGAPQLYIPINELRAENTIKITD